LEATKFDFAGQIYLYSFMTLDVLDHPELPPDSPFERRAMIEGALLELVMRSGPIIAEPDEDLTNNLLARIQESTQYPVAPNDIHNALNGENLMRKLAVGRAMMHSPQTPFGKERIVSLALRAKEPQATTVS
jgi:hypothetical protein